MPKATVSGQAKKKIVKKTIAKIQPLEETSALENTSSLNNISSLTSIKKPYLYTAVAALAVVLIAYLARGLFVAAIVNGQPITRLAVVKELEQQYGETTINSLITKSLIQQEAKKQNVQISDAEVDTEIKKIEDNIKQQGQNFDELLAAQNLTKDKLKEQIKLEKTIQKIIGKDIQVTDKDVQDYITANAESLPADSDPETLKPAIKQQLEQQKMSEKFQTWLEDLKKKAKINYLVNY